MTTYEFRVSPGSVAPDGAPSHNLTNIRQAIAPTGRAAALIARLSGSYDGPKKARISQCLFDLIDSGILAKLDLLCIRGLTEADSLINWAATSGGAVNQNATAWASGVGFTGDGVADWLDLSGVPYAHYQQNSASVFAYLATDQQLSGDYLMGVVSSGAGNNIWLKPGNSVGATVIARINHTTSITTSHVGTRLGLWCGTNNAGQAAVYRSGVQIIAPTAVTTTTPSTAGVAALRNSGAYGAYSVSAFGFGGYLTPAEQTTLAGAIAAMLAVI